MKKFVIISTVLLLIGAGVFGYSLYHYLEVTRPVVSVPVETTATEAPADPEQPTTFAGAQLDDGGIFSAYYEKASATVANMTKEQMIGQMLLGVTSDSSEAVTDVNRYSLAGVLFDSECFDGKTEEEVKSAVGEVRNAGRIVPILAAQEEGGRVTTVTGHADTEKTFSSPRTLFEEGGIAGVEKAEDEKAEYLKSLGFNLNLAPVVDMPTSLDQIMYSRSLSSDPQLVSTYAEYVAKFNQAKGVSVALKHFPGYGTINDTYESIVTDTRDATTIRTTDYIPFKAGVAAGAHFVMVSNVVVRSIDPTHTAATSSLLHQELRGAVGFTGVIMTDIIDRTDYSEYADGRSVPVAAVLAGNDLILVRDYAAAYTAILSAVNDNTIPIDTIQKACTRVVAYKFAAGLIE
jgi:beta-N-acetylhexosaminidase